MPTPPKDHAERWSPRAAVEDNSIGELYAVLEEGVWRTATQLRDQIRESFGSAYTVRQIQHGLYHAERHGVVKRGRFRASTSDVLWTLTEADFEIPLFDPKTHQWDFVPADADVQRRRALDAMRAKRYRDRKKRFREIGDPQVRIEFPGEQ